VEVVVMVVGSVVVTVVTVAVVVAVRSRSWCLMLMVVVVMVKGISYDSSLLHILRRMMCNCTIPLRRQQCRR